MSKSELSRQYLRAVAALPPIVDGDIHLDLHMPDDPTVAMSLESFVRISEAFAADPVLSASPRLAALVVDPDATLNVLKSGERISPNHKVLHGSVGVLIQQDGGEDGILLEGDVADVRKLLLEAIELLSAVEPAVGADIAEAGH